MSVAEQQDPFHLKVTRSASSANAAANEDAGISTGADADETLRLFWHSQITLHGDAAEIPAQLLFLPPTDADFVRVRLGYKDGILSERRGRLENDSLEGQLLKTNGGLAACG